MWARSIASRTFSSWTRRSPVYEKGYIGTSFMKLWYVYRYQPGIDSKAPATSQTEATARKTGSCFPPPDICRAKPPGCSRDPYEYLAPRSGIRQSRELRIAVRSTHDNGSATCPALRNPSATRSPGPGSDTLPRIQNQAPERAAGEQHPGCAKVD